MKPIRLSGYARSQLPFRGATEEEVRDAICSSPWSLTELRKLECSNDFPFGKEWNKKVYVTKRVRPIFIEEDTEIVVVTV